MKCFLYDEGVEELDLKKIILFIRENFGVREIKSKRLKQDIVKTKGVLFDFLNTDLAWREFIAKEKVDLGACHIIFTHKLFATLAEDRRPHIRASIYSFPSVISLPGIIEGPAKPREYYLLKQRYTVLRLWHLKEPEVKKKFRGQFIDYGDGQITEVIKGYVAQAIFFYLTGEPFCPKRICRLFNAHWQEDLIYSQIKKGKFCSSHRKILSSLGRDSVSTKGKG
jgi:hypothetical protein